MLRLAWAVGLCYQTWVLHGCRWLVHGRSDPQEDLLPPGDPAWGRGGTSAHRVDAAPRQGPLPALPIATREDGSVSTCRLTSTLLQHFLTNAHTHTHTHTHTHLSTHDPTHTHLISDTGNLTQASHPSRWEAVEMNLKHTDKKQCARYWLIPSFHVNEAAVHS